jgi:hypothetical protein
MAAKALSFDVGDYVVYPKHGVGRVIELQKQNVEHSVLLQKSPATDPGGNLWLEPAERQREIRTQ